MHRIGPVSMWLAIAAMPLVAQDHELVYDLPIDALQRRMREDPTADLEQLLGHCVDVVAARAGEGITVSRRTGSSFTVVVPAARAAEIQRLRRVIEMAGTLEMRLVAAPPRNASESQFDLPAERHRLETWLDAGGRTKVLADPRALDAFHLDAEHGPIAHGKLRWCIRRIGPAVDNARMWSYSLSRSTPLAPSCVALFDDRAWNGGTVPTAKDAPTSLVELVAIDLEERGFGNAELDLTRVRVEAAPFPGAQYSLRNEFVAAYFEWSRKYTQRSCAFLWNGEVVSAPRLMGALPGHGLIVGDFTVAQAEDLANVLRAGALPIAPTFVSERELPKK